MPDCTAPLSLEVCHGMSGVAHEDDVRRQSAVYLQHRPSLHYTPLNLNGIQFCHHGIRMVCINIGGYLVAGLVPQLALELPTIRSCPRKITGPITVPGIDFKNWPKNMDSIKQWIKGHCRVNGSSLGYVTR